MEHFISHLFPSAISTWCNKSKFPTSFPQATQVATVFKLTGSQVVLEETYLTKMLSIKLSKMGSSCFCCQIVLMFLCPGL